MWAARAFHAQAVQPGQGGEWDDVRAVVEQARVEPGRADQPIGIEAEIAQGQGDFPAAPEMDATAWNAPSSLRESVSWDHDRVPQVAVGTLGRTHAVIAHRHVPLLRTP